MTDRRQLALRVWPFDRRIRFHLLGLAIAVAVLTYLGPFGTSLMLEFPLRLSFWTITVGSNWLFAILIVPGAIFVFEWRRWPWWAATAVGSVVAALPGTVTVWYAVATFLDHRTSGLVEIGKLYSDVAVIHLVIGFLSVHLIERRMRRRGSGGETAPTAFREGDDGSAKAPILDRIPAALGRELLHLRMQDHYVEVHTVEGMDLVLLRFRDALREVEGIDGMQVHRSHWVARAAVAGSGRRNGRVFLRLVNGAEVPVSRSFAPTLRSQGWI